MAEEPNTEKIREAFQQFDLDLNGEMTSKEIGEVMLALGEDIPGYKLREIISSCDKDKDGTINFDEFLEVYRKENTQVHFSNFRELLAKVTGTLWSGGAGETGTSYSEQETVAFGDYINSILKDDDDVKSKLPITGEDGLFENVKDGILLCKLINLASPNTVDESAVNKGQLNVYLINENVILALNSARAIGCDVTNIAPDDIVKGKSHLVLGLIWQIIRTGLFANINPQGSPSLICLLQDGEDIGDLEALSPEETLLRWVNYHLHQSGSTRRVTNFSGDVNDSEVYSILLKRITPQQFTLSSVIGSDPLARAEIVLRNADMIGCKKFLTAKDIMEGNPKLNLAFVANLFNHYPAMQAAQDLDLDEEIYEESREEKTYRNWMNSLGVSPYVYHLYSDLSNGLILLQIFDKVKPGIVNWDKVHKTTELTGSGGTMKEIKNCNYVVELGKSMNFSLVGIGGEDIYNKTPALTLALIWQLMRAYTLKQVQDKTENGESVEDKEIVDWTNTKLQAACKTSRIQSFKDPSIAESKAILDLIDAVKPGIVNYESYEESKGDEEIKLKNAQYTISMARKIGAMVYARAEDKVEVKPKMMLTTVTSIMARALDSK